MGSWGDTFSKSVLADRKLAAKRHCQVDQLEIKAKCLILELPKLCFLGATLMPLTPLARIDRQRLQSACWRPNPSRSITLTSTALDPARPDYWRCRKPRKRCFSRSDPVSPWGDGCRSSNMDLYNPCIRIPMMGWVTTNHLPCLTMARIWRGEANNRMPYALK